MTRRRDGAAPHALQLLHAATDVLESDCLALRQIKGTHRPKLMLARLLHERATVCQTRIAKKLFMGSAATACQRLRRFNPRGLSATDLHQLAAAVKN